MVCTHTVVVYLYLVKVRVAHILGINVALVGGLSGLVGIGT